MSAVKTMSSGAQMPAEIMASRAESLSGKFSSLIINLNCLLGRPGIKYTRLSFMLLLKFINSTTSLMPSSHWGTIATV